MACERIAAVVTTIAVTNRAPAYALAAARFIAQRADVLVLGPPDTGKSRLAQAIGLGRVSGACAGSERPATAKASVAEAVTEQRPLRHLLAVASTLNAPYRSSSLNGTHLNSDSSAFGSMWR